MLGVLSGLDSGVEGDVLVEDGAPMSILVVHHQDFVKCWVVDVLVWEWGDLCALVWWYGLWLGLCEEWFE